jgi:hypothetical protein
MIAQTQTQNCPVCSIPLAQNCPTKLPCNGDNFDNCAINNGVEWCAAHCKDDNGNLVFNSTKQCPTCPSCPPKLPCDGDTFENCALANGVAWCAARCKDANGKLVFDSTKQCPVTTNNVDIGGKINMLGIKGLADTTPPSIVTDRRRYGDIITCILFVLFIILLIMYIRK